MNTEKKIEELIAANKELTSRNEEKEKMLEELIRANDKLKKSEMKLQQLNKKLLSNVNERTDLLAKSEEGHQRVLENTNDALIIDNFDGKIIYANDKYLSLFKFSKDDLANLNLEDYVAPDYREELRERHNKRVRGEKVTSIFEYQAINKNGELFWVEVSVVPVFENKSIVGTQSFIHDISARKEAEQKLEQNEKLFRAIIEKSSDMKTLATPDGKVFYVSPSLTKILGFEMAEIITTPAFDLIHPEDIEGLIAGIADIMQSPGKSFFRQQRLKHKNGSYRWCEGTITNMTHDPAVNALVSNFRDITDRKLAEEKLTASEKKYRYVFENNPMPMWIIDKESLKFLNVNEAAIKHYGYSKEEFLSMTAIDIRPEEEKEKFIAMERPVNEENKYKGTWKHLKKNGTIILVDIVASEITFEGKRVRLTLINDITETKKAEEKIKASEQKYRNVVENIHESLVIEDVEGKLLYANNEFCKMFGFQPEEFKTLSLKDYTSPDFYNEVIERHHKRMKNIPVLDEFEYKGKRKDGSEIWVEARVSTLTENGIIVGTQSLERDITERKKAQEKLIKSEKIYKTIASSIPGSVICLLDSDYNYQLIEGDMLEKLGYQKINVLGNNIKNVVTPEIFESVKKQFDLVIKGETVTREASINNYDIITRLIPLRDENNSVYGIMTVAIDVTELKTAHRNIIALNKELEQKVEKRTIELQKSTTLFTHLFNDNPGSILISRLSDAEILNVNDSFLYLFGFDSKEEVIGKTARQLNIVAHPEQREELAELLKTNKIVKDFEIKSFTKQGDVFWISTSILIMELNDEPCLFSISIDVSNRKKVEEELKAVNAELDSFTYSVSHDLRAPLRSIGGFTEILKNSYTHQLDDEAKRYMKVIVDSTQKMGSLIDELLAFSRLGKQQLFKKELDMNSMFHNVAKEIVKQQTLKNVEIHIGKLSFAYGDEAMMEQVVVNLISNAVKYTGKKEKAIIEIDSIKNNTEIIYSVKDNGAGFDMQYYNKLFAVFQRLHSTKEFKGTGVGLSIAYRIITKHNGKIWAKSKVNEGATFYFSLPDSSN